MNARIRLPILDQLIEEISPAPRARPKTIFNVARHSERELERGRVRGRPFKRPVLRSDCLPGGMNESRPCPFVSCKYNLILDVNETGSIKENNPGLELHELRETCALDVTDRGGATAPEVAEILNITKQGLNRVEGIAQAKVRDHFRAVGITEEDVEPDEDLNSWRGTRHRNTR